MKKRFAFLFAVLLALEILLCACGKGGADNPATTLPTTSGALNNISLCVVRLSGSTMLASAEDGGLYNVSLSNVEILSAAGKKTSQQALTAGTTVSIAYSGGIAESYPAQITSPVTIAVTGSRPDRVSLYEKAVKHIYENDPGLNGSVIVLDLDGAASLNAGDREALCRVLFNHYFSIDSTEVILGNYDSLSKENEIVNNVFEKGVIISIKDSGTDEFSISKWRSGTGAAGFKNCTAKYANGEWSIDYGEMHIS
ncbi:MAG: hypothetical protein GX051_09970 [Clostridiales bacterium]|nr:hypothetical protein [Clostridiales bacterium]